MLNLWITRIVFVGVIAALLLVPVPVAHAQTGAEPAIPEPFATVGNAVEVEDVAAFPENAPTNGEDALTDSPPKTEQQEPGLLVPTGEELVEPEQVWRVFLPHINNGGTVGQAQQGTAANISPTDANAEWRLIRSLSFEWNHDSMYRYDCNGTLYGEQRWGETSLIAYDGLNSMWPARNGRNGVDPRRFTYPNHACSWLIIGPFSLERAQSAEMAFRLWNKSELYFDHIGWYVSCDERYFTGWRLSGDTGGWVVKRLDLRPCLGDSTVWVGFKFTSDYSITKKGPFVDIIEIKGYW